MSESLTCARCGQNTFIDYGSPLLLPTLSLKNGEKVVNPLVGFGVTAKYCKTCGYVEFTHILNNEHLADILRRSK